MEYTNDDQEKLPQLLDCLHAAKTALQEADRILTTMQDYVCKATLVMIRMMILYIDYYERLLLGAEC